MISKRFTGIGWLLVTLLLSSASQAQTADSINVRGYEFDISTVPAAPIESPLTPEWWTDAVFYQVFVRAFNDSNGDGQGDIRGLIDKLDYIEALGVRGIWLMPMTLSHFHTNGYAVVDHRKLEPDYGSMDDFKELVDEAHRRGIGIIVDYVMNHSGVDHPLFRSATYGRNREHQKWFVWGTEDLGWERWDGRSVWHKTRGGEYYYGVFWHMLPDFNLRNPLVLEYHFDSMRMWMNLGIDGFRFDAVKHFVENGADQQEDQPETLAILKQTQDLVKSYDNSFIVCEAPFQAPLYAQEQVCGNAFSFTIGRDIIGSVKSESVGGQLSYNWWQLNRLPYTHTSTLLANHDPFAGKRLMEQFSDDEQAYKLAAGILLTLPGVPFVYYGEEIGMKHVRGETNKDFALRGIMSWTDSKQSAGFSQGRPFRGVAKNVQTHNVAMQEQDPQSLLNTYRSLIALRNANSALAGKGEYLPLSSKGDEVASYLRFNQDQQLLVLANLSDSSEEYHLDWQAWPNGLDKPQGKGWQELYPNAELSGASLEKGTVFKLAPRQLRVIQLLAQR